MVQAKDFDEAVALTKSCPMLNGEGNSVEIRKVSGVHNNE